MLAVPRLRQPDAVSCLPACVWAVLRYAGNAVSYEEVAEACRLGPLGAADEVTVQALMEFGCDVEVVTPLDLDTIRTLLEDDQPAIALFDSGRIGVHAFAHAVVICAVTPEALTVMDPLVGDYVSIPRHEAEFRLATRSAVGLFIAGEAPG